MVPPGLSPKHWDNRNALIPNSPFTSQDIAYQVGDSKMLPLRVNLERRLKLESWQRFSSDGGLLSPPKLPVGSWQERLYGKAAKVVESLDLARLTVSRYR